MTKKGREENHSEALQPAESAESTKAIPVIIHPDGNMEPIEGFLSRLEPEIADLRDKAIAAYRKELAELNSHLEKLSRNMPDDYREQFLRAGQVCREIVLTAHYGSEQGITPDNELMLALSLAYQAASGEVIEIVAQFVAASKPKKYSSDEFKEIFSILMIAAGKSPRKISKEQIENLAAEGREPKSFLFAAALLGEKHFLRTSRRLMEVLGLVRRRRSNEVSSRTSIYEKAAKYFVKLEQSGKHRSRERILDAVCKRFGDLAPSDYASLKYSSAKARSARKRVDSGIRHALANKE